MLGSAFVSHVASCSAVDLRERSALFMASRLKAFGEPSRMCFCRREAAAGLMEERGWRLRDEKPCDGVRPMPSVWG
jgi:hypothetical protein